MILILLYFIQLILFVPLYLISGMNSEFISFIFVIVNIFIVIFYSSFKIKHKKIVYISLVGLFIRLILLYMDLNTSFPILHSGSDTTAFNTWANHNVSLGFVDVKLTNYSVLLYWIYKLADCQRVVAQYFNIVLFMSLYVVLYQMLRRKLINYSSYYKMNILITFFPHLIIFSSILLREMWIIFFLFYSFYFFLLWSRKGKLTYIIKAVGSVLIASIMHSGVFFLLIGYVIASILYNPKTGKNIFTIKSLAATILFVVFFIGIMSFSDLFLSKFQGLDGQDSEEFMDSLGGANGGESAYLQGVEINTPAQALFYTPVKSVYFLFSPMIWNIRGSRDVVAFLLDALVYLFIIIRLCKFRKRLTRPYKFVLLGVFMTIIAFSWGTKNSGTAMRHRCKVVPLIALVAFQIRPEKQLKNQ